MTTIGILFVHGIGEQKKGEVISKWGGVIEHELARQRPHSLSGRGPRPAELVLDEVYWNPRVKAFAGLIVSIWTLLNLPRVIGVHAAMQFRSREEDSEATVGAIAWSYFGNLALRAVLGPAVLVPVICVLWVINPPVVLLSGLVSIFRSQKAESKDRSMLRRILLRWRPLRPANAIMARVVGDAYIWLVSPIGRWMSRGSQGEVTALFVAKAEGLRAKCDVVVAVAHSQGAAIAIKAATGRPKVVDHVITVGGGHRILASLESNRGERPRMHAISLIVQAAICVPIFLFMLAYVQELILVFVVAPWGGFTESLRLLISDPILRNSPSLAPSYANAIWVVARRLLEWGGVATAGVISLSVSYVFLCSFKTTRPVIASMEIAETRWTEIWSRFDPVCIGPRAERLHKIQAAIPKKYVPTPEREHQVVETWTLLGNHPLLEHTSYFRTGTTSVEVIGAELGSYLGYAKPVIVLPARASKVAVAKFWQVLMITLAPLILLEELWRVGWLSKLFQLL